MMTNQTKFCKILILLLSVLFAVIPVSAQEDGRVLKVYFHDNGKALEGAEFNVYFLAQKNSNGEITVSEDFKDYKDEIKENSTLALEGYVLRDKIAPDFTGVVNSCGYAEFKVKQEGLYLVVGKRFTSGNKAYDALPFTVYIETENVEADVKYSVHENIKNSVTSLKVLKVWSDEGFEKNRPQTVTVQLLKDGEIYDVVILGDDNNWCFEWKNLSSENRWICVEKKVNGYFASVEQEGNKIVLTNTYVTVMQAPANSPSSGTSKPSLPQTGMLWGPVALTATVGSLLIIAGLLLKKREKND